MEIKSRRPNLDELQEYIWSNTDGVCDYLALDDRFTPMEASMFAITIIKAHIDNLIRKND